MGFLNSIMPEYLLLKNNVANLAVLHCGFLNISSKVIVNWWLKFENFLKVFSGINLQGPYSAAWQSSLHQIFYYPPWEVGWCSSGSCVREEEGFNLRSGWCWTSTFGWCL